MQVSLRQRWGQLSLRLDTKKTKGKKNLVLSRSTNCAFAVYDMAACGCSNKVFMEKVDDGLQLWPASRSAGAASVIKHTQHRKERKGGEKWKQRAEAEAIPMTLIKAVLFNYNQLHVLQQRHKNEGELTLIVRRAIKFNGLRKHLLRQLYWLCRQWSCSYILFNVMSEK